jgi:hypothetical protein
VAVTAMLREPSNNFRKNHVSLTIRIFPTPHTVRVACFEPASRRLEIIDGAAITPPFFDRARLPTGIVS